MSELSIALLNYNGKTHLQRYLPSVVQHSSSFPIVVIDNGSTDDSVDYLKSHYPQIRLIEFDENHGFCGGYNRAMQLLDSKYVVLINTDVEVTANWIDPILDYLKTHPEVKAAQPKVLDDKMKTHFEYAGGSGGFLDAFGYPFCRGRIFETIEEDTGQYDNITKVAWASGSCLFIERETYISLGGLDERFFAHMEEIDLCWRIWNSGNQVVVVPQSKVYHLGGGTLHKSSPRKTYLNFRNGLSLLVKNEEAGKLLWKLPFRLVLDWIACFKFSIQSGPQHGLAILRAHLDFFREFKRSCQMRPKQFNRNRPRFKGLLVVSYFIFGQHTFQALKKRVSEPN